MAKMAITNKTYSDCGYAFLHGQNLHRWSPEAVARRVERGMGWLLSQPNPPHSIVLDDPSGIAVAFIVAWILTNGVTCQVTLCKPDNTPVGMFGINDDGYAVYTAFVGGE